MERALPSPLPDNWREIEHMRWQQQEADRHLEIIARYQREIMDIYIEQRLALLREGDDHNG